MSETCFYHPEAPAQDACPECTMPICADCVASGGGERCGSCAMFYQDNGELSGSVPAAGGAEDYAQPMCTHHANLAADMQCLNCFRPFCLSCASTGYCPECAPQFVNRTNAAQQGGYTPPADEVYVPPQMDMDFDLAGNYASDVAPGPSAAAAPRPRKRPPGPGGPPPKGGAKGKKPLAKKKGQPPVAAIAGGVALLLALAGGGYWFMTKNAAATAAAGPHKASITSPKPGVISGSQMIKVKLASAEAVEHVEVYLDGKLWGAKIKEAPFETDWPTSLAPNGKHKVEVKAFYKDGSMVQDRQEYQVKNAAP